MGQELPTLVGRDLHLSFGAGPTREAVLRGASLGLRGGQLVLLMGPSGSGKSTLLAVLSGLLRPDGGQVVALGQDLWRMTDKGREQFRRRHCGFVFQGYNLFAALTARQQLEVVLRWGEGVPGREARRRAAAMLGLLGLGGKEDSLPAQLSGGEQQCVAVGRALIKRPALLFADEPTGSLDWAHGREVVGLLREAAARDRATVLVVAHDARLVPYADQVFHMSDGHLSEQAAAPPAPRGAAP